MSNASRGVPYPLDQITYFGKKLDHSEGIAISQDGAGYAGGEVGQIYRISPNGQDVEEIARTGGFCLGLTEDRRDNIYVCDSVWRAVIKVDQSGRLSVFCDSTADGRPFYKPNFTVFDAEGNLYLSDSGEWKKNNGAIYRVSPRGEADLFHPGPFQFANGLALNAAEDALFVIESNADRIRRIEIRRDGNAGDDSIFCSDLHSVPDGMAFDAFGQLYVGCFGLNRLYVVDCEGKTSLLCEDTENATLSVPTNCAFGGVNFDKLFVSCLGGTSVAVLDLGVRGQRLYSHNR